MQSKVFNIETGEWDTVEVPDVVLPPDATNEATLNAQLQAALTQTRSYLALTSPTGAQNTAQVRLLSRTMIALIRLQLRQLDATN